MVSEESIIVYVRKQVSFLLEGKFDLVYNAMSDELKEEYTDVDHLIKNYESMIKHMGFVKETLQFATEYEDGSTIVIEDLDNKQARVDAYVEAKCYAFLDSQLEEDEDGYYMRSNEVDDDLQSCGIELILDISSDEIKINELYFGI